MDFEYGCVTVNKFCFLDENEVEDPSDLLAQVTLAKEASAKDAKKDAKGKKVDPKTGKPVSAGKDAKKQPLQQQIDNSVKSSKQSDDKKDTGRQPKTQKPAQPSQPREDKENSLNRQANQQGSGDNQARRQGGDYQNRPDRRPRPEGESGFRQDRPPRRTGPRPEGESGFRGGDRPDRPPRQNRRPEGGFDNEAGTQLAEGENAHADGFRGGYRGPRGAARGGQAGNFRSGPYRPRRTPEGGNEGGREFDRHSGSEKTGIKAVDKKDGAGRGNWGTAADELVAEETLNEIQNEQAGGENQNWAERVDESEEAKKEGGEGENEEGKEVVPNFMTLDEYKNLKSQINKRNDFNIRRPGEGEDLSKWGKTYILPKKADEEDEAEEEEEEEEEEVEEDAEDQQKKNLIKSIQASFKFNDLASSSRGDRRGPGGERGGRGGGQRRDFVDRRKSDRQGETEAPVGSDAPATVAAEQSPAVQASSPADEAASPSDKRRFNNQPRGGPRGGARGGARGGPRGGQQKVVSAPKFDDEKDFPTLGK